MDLDGTKRRADGRPVSRGSILDFGATPPWTLPPTYHQESALRFTQMPAEKPTIDPAALHHRRKDSATEPLAVPSWTALNKRANNAQQIQTPKTSRKRVGRQISPPLVSPLTQCGDDDGEVEIMVDMEDGRDGVYMMNAKAGSWSGSLSSEDDLSTQEALPWQATQALKHLKLARERSAHEAQTARHPSSACSLHSTTFTEKVDGKRKHLSQTDLLLCTAMSRVKHRLRDGHALTLERSHECGVTVLCASPICPASEHKIPYGAYYVRLSDSAQLLGDEAFCLFCLEDLWLGKRMLGPLPDPCVKVTSVSVFEKDIPGLSLDGAPDSRATAPRPHQTIPISLLESRHAPKPGDIRLSTPERDALATSPETPGFLCTPGSTTSTGAWKDAPTRFQHLAAHLKAGGSLSEREKAAVGLWKAASKEQLHWEAHLERAAHYRTGCPAEEDDEEVVEDGDAAATAVEVPGCTGVEGRESVDEESEGIAGVSRQRCRRKDLSTVLGEMRSISK